MTDRPTKSHEYVFLLAKNSHYYYDADAASEVVLTEGAEAGSRPKQEKRNRRTVLSINCYPSPESHFATYPIQLPELCIRAGSPEDGVVLDPFSGAGTTGLACLKTNRRYLGIELNPEYVQIAYRRARKHYSLLLAA